MGYITHSSPAANYALEVAIPEAFPGELCYSFGSGNNQDYNNNSPIEGVITSFSIDGSNNTSFHIARNFTPNFPVGATFVVTGVLAPYTYLNGVTYTVTSVSNDVSASTGFTVVATGLTHATVATTTIAGLADTTPTLGTEHSVALPGTATLGLQFAVPSYIGQANQSPAITYEYELGGTVSAYSISLMGALRDVAAEYFALDTKTGTSAESKSYTISLGSERVKFLALQVNSSTNTNGT